MSDRFDKIFGASQTRWNNDRPGQYNESDDYNDYRHNTNQMNRNTTEGLLGNTKIAVKSFKKVFGVGIPVSAILTTLVLSLLTVNDYKKTKNRLNIKTEYEIVD